MSHKFKNKIKGCHNFQHNAKFSKHGQKQLHNPEKKKKESNTKNSNYKFTNLYKAKMVS